MKTTTIKCTEDLFNGGKCFTEGEYYTVNGTVANEAGLMEKRTINDLGELHIISSWWRKFEIVD